MAPKTTTSFLELSYQNPSFPHLEIECMRLSELKRRMPASFFKRTQRPRFHLLSLFIQGPARQEIDFVKLPCEAGTLLHVRPDQVIRYVSIEQAEALMILFTPGFLWPEGATGESISGVHLRDDFHFPSRLELAGADFEAVRPMFELIEREYETTDAGKLSEALMRHLLMALLLRIDRAAMGDRPPSHVPPVQHATFLRFQQELERQYMRTRAVQDYARSLGCAPRTLNRATFAMAGIPVKQYIDERVALEAKRLLAHTTLSISEIAYRLGFSEPTNFAKFIRRGTGLLPGEFRDAQSGGARA